MTDLQSRLRGLWLPLVTPFRERRTRRSIAAAAGPALRGPARRRTVLAATTGESLTLEARKQSGWLPSSATKLSAAATTSDLPRPVRQQHAGDVGSAGRNRGMADRRISDLLPVLFAAVAERNDQAFQRAGRPGRTPGPALQHSLPDRRQSRQRGDAATGRHPNIIGLRTVVQSARNPWSCCAGVRPLRRSHRRGRAILEALIDGADGAILASAHVETETFASVGSCWVRATAMPHCALAFCRGFNATAVRRAEPGADQVLAVAHRIDRQRRSAVADDGGERRAGCAA